MNPSNPTPRRRRPLRSPSAVKTPLPPPAASASSRQAEPRHQASRPLRQTAPRGTAQLRPTASRRKVKSAPRFPTHGILLLLLLALLISVSIRSCLGEEGNAEHPSTESSPSSESLLESGSESESEKESESLSGGESEKESDKPPESETIRETESHPEPPPALSFTLPSEVQSRTVLLIERQSGKVIFSQNASATVFPASITKIMTVLVAIENLDNLDRSFTVTADLLDRLYALGASRAGFKEGERVRAIDLMYASLLPSGADGSIGLAELVAGGEEAFAVLMNRKAAEIGMTSTHFVNATGLHDPNHVSSAEDLAILLDYALKNEAFRQIFTTASYRSGATDEHPNGLRMKSTMRTYLSECELERDYLLGGKTGFTSKAGLCLASLAELDGKEYMLITLGAGDGSNYPRYQVIDAVLIFDALRDALSKVTA